MEKELKTVIKGRYELSRQINQCGETVVYLGYDFEKKEHITIREFFSKSIMRRDEKGCAQVLPDCDVKYKSLSSDYEELCAYLTKLPEKYPVIRPFDVVWENNTVYSVEGYAETQTLDDYLARQQEPLNWNKLKKMITPLIKLLGKMHSDGVYHRGISPETLLVAKDNELLLSGFCIPAARTYGSEIEATLYFGYSSPEQYSSNSWQGSWSDVYSLAAVCYRALTGVTPVEWRQRGKGRELPEPIALQADIPQNVSDALMKALNVELSGRYRTIEELWCELLVGSGEGTVTYSLPILKRMSDEQQKEPQAMPQLKSAAYFKQPVIIALASISCVAFFAIALANNLVNKYIVPNAIQSSQSQQEISQSNEPIESSQTEIVVPNLIGINIEKVLLDPLYQRLFTFQIERVFSEAQPVGAVVSQQPKAGEMPRENSQIYLWVSNGTERIIMPDVIGLDLKDALQVLDMSDIGYNVGFVEIENAAEDIDDGMVLETSIAAGALVYRNSDTITVSVALVKDEQGKDRGDSINWEEYVYVVPPRKETYWPPQEFPEEYSSASSQP